ncbi:hypothetical protein J8273_3228 [Carpediemonas membranifera]|uniref:Uncharacterized protein n=1 Tax=Carpediemonas membranifera TaxID=201153 RepID=A0A8J6DZ38_9EUKA|nr:hypothetical protein J8273_3228 [Carpediemonas membranifera]|eukprot:KAG9393099.1 hypothetical protein J8273_3228 [Carpediemonas membranifera]
MKLRALRLYVTGKDSLDPNGNRKNGRMLLVLVAILLILVLGAVSAAYIFNSRGSSSSSLHSPISLRPQLPDEPHDIAAYPVAPLPPTRPIKRSKEGVERLIIVWSEMETQADAARLLISLHDCMAFSKDIPPIALISDGSDEEFDTRMAALGDVTVRHRSDETIAHDVGTLLKAHSKVQQVFLLAPGVVFRSGLQPEAYSDNGLHLHPDTDGVAVVTGRLAINQVQRAMMAGETPYDAIAQCRENKETVVRKLIDQDVTVLAPNTEISKVKPEHALFSHRRTMMFVPDGERLPALTGKMHLAHPTQVKPRHQYMTTIYRFLDDRYAAADWMEPRRPLDPATDAYVFWLTGADHAYCLNTLSSIFGLRQHTTARIILATQAKLDKFSDFIAGLDELGAEHVYVNQKLPVEVSSKFKIDEPRYKLAVESIQIMNLNRFLRKPVRRAILLDPDVTVLRCPDHLFSHPSDMVMSTEHILFANSGLVKWDLENVDAKGLFSAVLEFMREPSNVCQFPGHFWMLADQEILFCFANNYLHNMPQFGSNVNCLDSTLDETLGPFLSRYNDTVVHHFTGSFNPQGKQWSVPVGGTSMSYSLYWDQVECLTGTPLQCTDKAAVSTFKPGVCSRCYCRHDPRPGAVDVSLRAWVRRHSRESWWGTGAPACGPETPYTHPALSL